MVAQGEGFGSGWNYQLGLQTIWYSGRSWVWAGRVSDGYSGCRWLCLVMVGREVGSEWFGIRAEVGG